MKAAQRAKGLRLSVQQSVECDMDLGELPSTPIKETAAGLGSDVQLFSPPRSRFVPGLDPVLLSPSCNTLRFKRSHRGRTAPLGKALSTDLDESALPVASSQPVAQGDRTPQLPRQESPCFEREHGSVPATPSRDIQPLRNGSLPQTPPRTDKMQRARSLTNDSRGHPYFHYPTPVTPSRYVGGIWRSVSSSPVSRGAFFPSPSPSTFSTPTHSLSRTSSLRSTAEQEEWLPPSPPSAFGQAPMYGMASGPGYRDDTFWTSQVPLRASPRKQSHPKTPTQPAPYPVVTLTSPSHAARFWQTPIQPGKHNALALSTTPMDSQMFLHQPYPSPLPGSFALDPEPTDVQLMRIEDLLLEERAGEDSKKALHVAPMQTRMEPTITRQPKLEPAAASEVRVRGPTLRAPAEGDSGEIFTNPTAMRAELLDADGDSLSCELQSTTHNCFIVVDGKWACYRRNYLKIDTSCSVMKRASGQLAESTRYFVRQHGSSDLRTVSHFTVGLSAHIADHLGGVSELPQHEIPLIQFGPARERGPRTEVYPRQLELSGEPAAGERSPLAADRVAAFRRIQIRSATLNNGQRGHAGQQYFALKLTLYAHLQPVLDPRSGTAIRRSRRIGAAASAGRATHAATATSAAAAAATDPVAGTIVEVACTVSQPITVRGRSKMHYQALSEQRARQRLQGEPGKVTAVKMRAGTVGAQTRTEIDPDSRVGSATSCGMGSSSTNLDVPVRSLSSSSSSSSSDCSDFSFDSDNDGDGDGDRRRTDTLMAAEASLPSSPTPAQLQSRRPYVMDIRNVI
ncbi:uncharacterized protein PFL1_03909 [Pseudozyma flocculosa PF-1]|uniref:NDT80 domain-containing protein n=1 Tax=Pseudozyma flocculosa PF-1 TaxID=1277687 RepID=A0A061HDB1_9BASI|nr:uncharacterized protein PFL1_03909 [Pseudozyma flocculosa PF-1]EPQ28606.1 hypothetical protein PFL1_03909 [Pseudozyma flocculosa PF-1]